MRPAARAIRLLAGAACVLATACDSATANRSFTIALSEPAATLGQGGTRNLTLTITRSEFEGAIALTVEGMPPGVIATFTPASATGTSATLQLVAGGNAAPGVATLTVRATGEGVAEQTTTLQLTITVTGSFTLGALDPTLIAAQGGGASTAVLVNRMSGFVADVSIALSGAPAGMTATIAPASTAGNSVHLSVAAGASVTPGSYTLTATGTTAGLANQQTAITVNVITAPAQASLTLTFCAANPPAWVAYRNEGYEWQTASASGTSYTFQATARLSTAVVAVSPDGASKQTTIVHGARAELSHRLGTDCGGSKTVNGSVAGLSTAQQAFVAMGAMGPGAPVASSAPGFTISNLPERPLDLIATQGIESGGAFTPSRMIIRRSLSPASGATLPALDFAAAEAFQLQQNNLTLGNTSAGEQLALSNTLWSATSTYGAVHRSPLGSANAVFYSVPASQLAGGDVHELYLDAFQSSLGVGRSMLTYFAAPAERSESFGAFLEAPQTTTLTSTPYLRLRGRINSQADYASGVRFGWQQQPAAGDRRTVFVVVTSGYLGGTPAQWDVTIPDFTGVSGFNAGWMLGPNQATAWQVLGFGGRIELLFDALPAAGDILKFSDRQGLISAGNLRVFVPRNPLVRSQYLRR